jgi:hypothetical protein
MEAQTTLLFVFIVNLLAWIFCTYYAIWLKRAPLYHPIVLFLLYFLFGYVYTPLADWIQGYSEIWVHDSLFPTALDIFYGMFISLVGLLSFAFIPPLLDKSIYDRLSVRQTRLVVTRPTVFWIAVIAIGLVGLVSTIGGLATNNAASIGKFATAQQLTGVFQLTGVSGYQTIGQSFVPALIFVLVL